MTPGRSVAIVIGVPIVLLLFVAAGFSLVGDVGTGSYPVSETLPLPDGKLALSLNGGDVTLRGSNELSGTARVAGTVSYHFARPTLRMSADAFSLHCPIVDTGNCSLDAAVDLPAGTALTVSTGGGDLSAAGLAGDDTLSTNGGNLTITGAAGNLALTSGGGDVSASHVNGPVVAISADGGNIGGNAVSATRVTADSGGGEITLTFTTVPRDLQVSSDGGDVTIVVPPGSYYVSTNTGGGNLNHSIGSTPGAPNFINVSSGGGDISLSQS
jgi:hypothetical protein